MKLSGPEPVDAGGAPNEDRAQRIQLRDISPRLTFQSMDAGTGVKVELAERLIAAGYRAMEVSSFVREDLVPGLADAEAVFGALRYHEDVSLEACVGNERGLQRAMDAGADAAWFMLSVSETFSSANIGRTITEALVELERMRQRSEEAPVSLGSYVIAAFGGPTGPALRYGDVRPVLERLLSLGVDNWILADSFGYAGPTQTVELLRCARALNPHGNIALQVHDTRGMGIANIAGAVGDGFRHLDVSLAGSGGHPALPNAQVGGVCAEDAVQLLELMGYDPGLDLAALVETANWLEATANVNMRGFVRHVGPVPRAGSASASFGFAWPDGHHPG